MLLAAALLAAWLARAEAVAAVPALTARVTDQTGTLGVEQLAALEQRLATFEARKGAQLAVLIVPTTAPEPIEQYALRVAEQWKLGRAKVDDAAILVVAKNDRALRIEVGYGLEGVLPDATAKRIIDEVIAPRFSQQDYAGGITAGMEQLMRVVDGEPLPPPDTGSADGGPLASLPALVAIAFVMGAVLRALLGRLRGSLATGTVLGVAAWWMQGALAAALLAGLVGVAVSLFGGLGFLPFNGGGRRGGSGGGGFRGGGGGFGGGGASGKW
ncbi:MAG TPA: YgcG family protein [Roseateles sp.]